MKLFFIKSRIAYSTATLLISIVMFACKNGEDVSMVNLYNELIEGRSIAYDSTMSKEKRQAYKKLFEVVTENLKLQDDKLVFMNKDEFLSKGFPEALYDKFALDLESSNAAMAKDSMVLNLMKEKFPKLIANIKEEIAEW